MHRTSPLPFSRAAAIAAATACLSLFAATLGAQKPATSAKTDVKTISHVLNRLGYGARPGDVARVQAMGVDAYIDQQLHPERIDDGALDARLADFDTLAMSTQELNDKYFGPAEMLRRQQKQEAGKAAATPDDAAKTASPALQQARAEQVQVINQLMQAKMLRATLSERQLDEVLVDFWFNHFNVFVGKGQVRTFLTEYEREAIRPHVLGSFRELLGAVAHSPAMLFYLDNFQSQAPAGAMVLSAQNDPRRQAAARRGQMIDPRRQMARPQAGRALPMPRPQLPPDPKRPARGLNENYARELMELHTLGVDGGYTQQDVIELARILSGWTIDRPQLGGTFVFRPAAHDAGEKTLLGTRFPAGHGEDEGERALDLLAQHPATAHHIAYQLAQRFVADEPPAALVDRAAKVFRDTKGDLREVTRTIVTSPEFFAPAAYRAKVKTPLEFVVSAVRATGATVVNAQPMVVAMRNLGMPLYGAQPPTGYSMTADAWVNTGALLNRMNFAVDLMNGGRVQPQQAPGRGNGKPLAQAQAGDPSMAADPNAPAMTPEQRRARQLAKAQAQNGRGGAALRALARGPLQVDLKTLAPDTSAASRDALIAALLAGDASDATRQTLARAETTQNLVALTLGSPDFQRR